MEETTVLGDVGGELTGRVAIVTGSSGGIGLAIARRMTAAGASVVINSRSQQRADAAAQGIGGRTLSVGADVTDPEGVKLLVDGAVAAFGRVDILVNNAGQTNSTPTLELTPDAWQEVLQLNLTGSLLCAQAVGALMVAAGSGVIINIGSIWGHQGLPARVAYGSAKHAISGMTKVLASEWGPRGVRVLSVDPGYTSTELVSRLVKDGAIDEEEIISRTPLRRLAEPEDIAEVVTFMASDRARFITGTSILVDGGWTAYGGW